MTPLVKIQWCLVLLGCQKLIRLFALFALGPGMQCRAGGMKNVVES